MTNHKDIYKKNLHEIDNSNLLKKYHIIYSLYAFGMVSLGIPWLIAIVINYSSKNLIKNTWFESHYKWLVSTFWFNVVFIGICYSIFESSSGNASGCGNGVLILIPLTLALYLWNVYRIYVGWLRLFKNQAILDVKDVIKEQDE